MSDWIPLEPAVVPESEVERLLSLSEEEKRDTMPEGVPPEEFDAFIRQLLAEQRVYRNHLYQVAVRELGDITHLSIKRIDKTPVRDWRHFQRIKNELCGPEREAVELYPAESRLVDSANQYHLWVFPEGFVVPVGFEQRYVRDDSMAGAVQRPTESA